MSKQRNEPKDVLSEVVDYDESKTVGGTSDDDKGNQETQIWPGHMQPSDLNTDKQRQVWKDWVRSPYSEPTTSNIVKFAKDKSYSEPTARRIVMKGARSQRDLQDLRNAERLAVAIVAYEGNNKSARSLGEKYPLSEHTFTFAIDSFPDLVDEIREQYGKLEESDIQRAIEKYKESGTYRSEQKRKEESKEEQWNEIAKQYFLENPGATPEEIRKETGIKASDQQIWGLHANLVRYNYLDGSQQTKMEQHDTEENDDSSGETGLTIKLEFDSSEVLELINGDSETFDVRERVVERVVEKAFE